VIESCADLKAGDVFTWENYPLFVNEQKDRRWFLFLGHRALESISNFFKIDAGVGGLIKIQLLT
jgi:hypothetical protein